MSGHSPGQQRLGNAGPRPMQNPPAPPKPPVSGSNTRGRGQDNPARKHQVDVVTAVPETDSETLGPS